jgi:hypothetical protein
MVAYCPWREVHRLGGLQFEKGEVFGKVDTLDKR